MGFTYEQIPSMEGKVAIVTGANTGLGRVSAFHLAKLLSFFSLSFFLFPSLSFPHLLSPPPLSKRPPQPSILKTVLDAT